MSHFLKRELFSRSVAYARIGEGCNLDYKGLDGMGGGSDIYPMDTIALTPVSFERIAAEKFLELSEKQKRNIKDIRIVPPSFENLDDTDCSDFGSIVFEYKMPVYAMRER